MKFIKLRKISYLVSGLLILFSLYSIIFLKGFNYSIDFTGGVLLHMKFNKNITAAELRKVITSEIKGNIVIQNIGLPEDNQFIIKTKYEDEPEKKIEMIKNVVNENFAEKEPVLLKNETVGPTIGKELRKLAFILIGISLLGILIYISIRFKFNYAVAAVLALIHDVTITSGMLSFYEKEIDIPIIAALLTIIGYSLNDTIVVFDRIREWLVIKKGETLENIIDSAINSTLTRTAMTSLTTLLAVFALFIFGGPVIHNFALTMLVGIIVGTYSSIFVASPIYYDWEMALAKRKKS